MPESRGRIHVGAGAQHVQGCGSVFFSRRGDYGFRMIANNL